MTSRRFTDKDLGELSRNDIDQETRDLAAYAFSLRRALREVRACLTDHAIHPRAYRHSECEAKIDRALGARRKKR